MLNTKSAKAIIRESVRSSILSFVKSKLNRKHNFQILDLIIPQERRIRSIVGGLETSMGKTLWEPLGKELAKANGFTIIEERLEAPANMPSNLGNTLQTIIGEREKGSRAYSATTSHRAIKKVCQTFKDRPIHSFEAAPRGHGVDVWLRKNNVNYFFDTKTVQPNVGDYKKFLSQILNWYAFFYSRYPTQKAEGRIVFPYNPYSGNFWEKTKGKGFPLEPDTEGWIENQFWDFCSGLTGTFKLIQDVFADIGRTKELEQELDSILKIK